MTNSEKFSDNELADLKGQCLTAVKSSHGLLVVQASKLAMLITEVEADRAWDRSRLSGEPRPFNGDIPS